MFDVIFNFLFLKKLMAWVRSIVTCWLKLHLLFTTLSQDFHYFWSKIDMFHLNVFCINGIACKLLPIPLHLFCCLQAEFCLLSCLLHSPRKKNIFAYYLICKSPISLVSKMGLTVSQLWTVQILWRKTYDGVEFGSWQQSLIHFPCSKFIKMPNIFHNYLSIELIFTKHIHFT